MFNPCSFCPAHCCKTYTITTTIFDILRICEKTSKSPEEFVVLHQARLLSYDPDMTMDMSDDPYSYLIGLKSHPCIFLDKENKCSIHEFAPLSCKRYPFTLNGKINGRFCPIINRALFTLKGPDINQDKIIEEIIAHKKIVKKWNCKPAKKIECINFLINEAKKINI